MSEIEQIKRDKIDAETGGLKLKAWEAKGLWQQLEAGPGEGSIPETPRGISPTDTLILDFSPSRVI